MLDFSRMVDQDLSEFLNVCICQGYLQNLMFCENLSNYNTRYYLADDSNIHVN
jgi:hypothetical protein